MDQKRTKYIKKLKELKKIVSRDIDINKFILFGSRSKGGYKRYSDFDIIVVSKYFKNINRLDRPYILYTKWNFNLPVDFLCYTPEEFNKLKKQITIVQEAVKEGIEIK
ncbi:MAG: nucleotidyltransferase domain-containing protein [Nanoarchaeota archaeon]|nr:nucleotidyltransferase domain-containing protein [Nanoarchaeota archaeon]